MPSDDEGWRSFDLAKGFQSMNNVTKDIVCKMIRAIKDGVNLSEDDIKSIKFACWNSMVGISDEEVENWGSKPI